MKNFSYILLFLVLAAMIAISCDPYETPVPGLSDFAIYELSTDANGNLVTGAVVTSPEAGETFRLEMLADADIAVVWPGDVLYRPWGVNDSIIDSRNYADIGKPGAQGLTTSSLQGGIGYFRDFAWQEAGSYTITVVLTNHGLEGPDFEQRVFEFDVTVVP